MIDQGRPTDGRVRSGQRRRVDLSLSDSELADFLAGNWLMVVGTASRTGWPLLTTVMYGLIGGDLAFTTFAKSQKAVNLQRDPRVTCLVEVHQMHYSLIKGVQVFGSVELIEDADVALDLVRRIRANADAAMPNRLIDKQNIERSEQLIAKRSVFVVRPERVISWDHAKLHGRY